MTGWVIAFFVAMVVTRPWFPTSRSVGAAAPTQRSIAHGTRLTAGAATSVAGVTPMSERVLVMVVIGVAFVVLSYLAKKWLDL